VIDVTIILWIKGHSHSEQPQQNRNRSDWCNSFSGTLSPINDAELNPFPGKADSEVKVGRLRENPLN
jgi:hypothetical protein